MICMTRRATGLTFEFPSPDGGEDWTFTGSILPPEPTVGLFSAAWEVESVVDSYGDERDPEALDALWWERVCAEGDRRANDEYHNETL